MDALPVRFAVVLLLLSCPRGGATKPLTVEVTPAPAPARPPARTPTRVAPLQQGDGPPTWAEVAPSPLFLPHATGRAAPLGELRLAADPHALWMQLTGIPADHRVEALVDPDGLAARWFTLELDAGDPRFARCGFPPLDLPFDAALHPAAAPCDPAVGSFSARRRGATIEVRLPWADMPPSTDGLRVQVVTRGPGGAGGALAAPAERLAPHATLPVEVRPILARLDVTSDLGADRWRVRLQRPGDAPWTCALMQRGVRLHEETLPPGAAGFEIPIRAGYDLGVACREVGETPLAPSARSPVDGLARMALATPVFREVLAVAYRLPGDARAVPVQVRDTRGRLLGSATVDLGRGRGELRLPADPQWPDTVQVTLGPWLTATAVRAAP